jgi:hypothetical protein
LLKLLLEVGPAKFHKPLPSRHFKLAPEAGLGAVNTQIYSVISTCLQRLATLFKPFLSRAERCLSLFSSDSSSDSWYFGVELAIVVLGVIFRHSVYGYWVRLFLKRQQQK